VLVPAKEEIEVSLDGGEERLVEFGGGDEGREEIAQSRGIHRVKDKWWRAAKRRAGR
jgi:hypothetical protein